jgi:hypothetical protein
MQLNQYLKLKKIPDWLEKALISQQRKRFDNPSMNHSRNEAMIIKQFYNQNSCNTFIDMGCWLGILSSRVKRSVNPERIILVDAVPVYLHLAKQLLIEEDLSSNVEIIEMTVIDSLQFPKFITVDLDDTIRTSSIKNCQEQLNITVNLPIANPKTCKDAAIEIANLAPLGAYLKTDLDGVDYSFLQELLNINYLPNVVQFEAWLSSTDNVKKCISILEQFAAVGYEVPSPDELTGSRISNIIISRQAYKIYRLI